MELWLTMYCLLLRASPVEYGDRQFGGSNRMQCSSCKCLTVARNALPHWLKKEKKGNINKKTLTRFGTLQMEGGLLFLGERCPLALETGTQPVEVEVVTAVVQCGRLTVDIAPIGTDLSFLIESRTIGTEEAEILHLCVCVCV